MVNGDVHTVWDAWRSCPRAQLPEWDVCDAPRPRTLTLVAHGAIAQLDGGLPGQPQYVQFDIYVGTDAEGQEHMMVHTSCNVTVFISVIRRDAVPAHIACFCIAAQRATLSLLCDKLLPSAPPLNALCQKPSSPETR